MLEDLISKFTIIFKVVKHVFLVLGHDKDISEILSLF